MKSSARNLFEWLWPFIVIIFIMTFVSCGEEETTQLDRVEIKTEIIMEEALHIENKINKMKSQLDSIDNYVKKN